MRSHPPQIGRRAAVVAALLALLVATTAIGAGCGSKDAAQKADVGAALKAASAALVSKDAVAWFLALPCEGTTAQYDSYQTYIGLSRYPWAKVTAKAVPVAGVQGRYRVRFYGRLKGSDKAPLLCERDLDFAWREGRLRLVADRTEQWRRGTYYLAFTRPLVIVRPHIVVVGDRWHEKLMSRIAACDGQALRVATRLHLDPDAPELKSKTLVYVCASPEQTTMAAFARVTKHAVACETDQQVYVNGGCGRYLKKYTPETVRHELTHVYAPAFGEGKHFVGLLVEGLAVAVEDGDDFSALRAEVASGNRVLPLKRGLMHGDVWKGFSARQRHLAYLEGGALVLYLEKRWGMKGAWAFADAVTNSDRTPAGIDQATRESLRISWRELYRGWKGYVRTLR